jgi:hypothetical protein
MTPIAARLASDPTIASTNALVAAEGEAIGDYGGFVVRV